MNEIKFNPEAQELVDAFAASIETACERLDFDLRCLDWFSYTPDFFISHKDQRAA